MRPWTEIGSVFTIYKMNGHDRFFITAAQTESFLSPYLRLPPASRMQ